MKKEFLAAAMVIGAAAALMSGCGKDKIVGEWTVSKIQLDGMTEPKPVEDVIREQAAQARMQRKRKSSRPLRCSRG